MQQRPPVCRYFSGGYCRYGVNCRFRHEIQPGTVAPSSIKRKRDSAPSPQIHKTRKRYDQDSPYQYRDDNSKSEALPTIRRTLPRADAPPRLIHQSHVSTAAKFQLQYDTAAFSGVLRAPPAVRMLSAVKLPTLLGRQRSAQQFFDVYGEYLTKVRNPSAPKSRVFPVTAVLAPPGHGKTTFLASLCNLSGVSVGRIPHIPFGLKDVAGDCTEAWKRVFPVYVTFNDTGFINVHEKPLNAPEKLSLRIIHSLLHPQQDYAEFTEWFMGQRASPDSPLHDISLSLNDVVQNTLQLISKHTSRSSIFLAVDEILKLDTPDLDELLSELGRMLDSFPRTQFNLIISTLSDSPRLLRDEASRSGRPIAWIPLDPVHVFDVARSFRRKNAVIESLVELLEKGTSDLFPFFNDPQLGMTDLQSRRNAHQLLTTVVSCGGHLRSISNLYEAWNDTSSRASLVDWFQILSKPNFVVRDLDPLGDCILVALEGRKLTIAAEVGSITAKRAIECNYFTNAHILNRPRAFVPSVSFLTLYRWASNLPGDDPPQFALLARALLSTLGFAEKFLWQHAEQFAAHIIAIRSCVYYGKTLDLVSCFGEPGVASPNLRNVSVSVNLIDFETLQSESTCSRTLKTRGIGSSPGGLWRICSFAPNNPGFDLLIVIPYLSKSGKTKYAAVAIEIKHSSERASTELPLEDIVVKRRLAKEQLKPLRKGTAKGGLGVSRWYLFVYAHRKVASDVVSASLPKNDVVLDRNALRSFFSPTLAALPSIGFS
eukprot:TRINITY_DN8978_c0_g1_i1.p1 TRINITY_DN8978_c0_g1~~TRINITY_DN8978_c0_g1_i1.p1  ORF type:complete len:767 (+),score=72.44 TRINITY_DN8978_c0_g1_i1:52-2352(+)